MWRVHVQRMVLGSLVLVAVFGTAQAGTTAGTAVTIGGLGACPRKKPLKSKALELRRGDLKIGHFLETRILTGDQNFFVFLKNP